VVEVTLTDLLWALDQEAEDELASAEQSARSEADAIRSAARADADRLVAAAVADADVTARATAARQVAAARSAAAADFRAAREQALLHVHEQVQSALDGLRDRPEHEIVQQECLSRALARVPAAATVHCDPRDAALVGWLVGELPVAVVPDRPTRGGVVVSGGGRSADSTLETRLAGAWPGLRGRLAAGWVEEAS